MIVQRPGHARGRSQRDGRTSWHAFSSGNYHDPQWMGFGPLRVLNEECWQARAPWHCERHANMEIITWVISGALRSRSCDGEESLLQAGQGQCLSAGYGTEHDVCNALSDQETRCLQIRLQPDRVNAPPRCEKRAFAVAGRQGCWQWLASPDGRENSLVLRQDAGIRLCTLPAGGRIDTPLLPVRDYWLQLIDGEVQSDRGQHLQAGDALALRMETQPLVLINPGAEAANFLLLDLPR